jgi:arylsulfatase A-like enzyme
MSAESRPALKRAASALAVALLALLLGACGPARPRSPRHVFLITIDTLRADHMSTYGYPRVTSPRIQELADAGVLFERAIVQWPKTGASLASVFVGQYPQTTGITHDAAVRVPAAYLTLPELFQRHGFRTVAVVSNGVLSTELGWNAGFDEFIETWPEEGVPKEPEALRRALFAGRVNELALPALERHAGAEHLFFWLHYFDPHGPYILPQGFANPFLDDDLYQGSEMLDLEALGIGHRLDPHRELKYYVAQYDANIVVVDRAIGEVIERARSLGLLDDALVVLTADHGESLGEQGRRLGHGPLPYNTTAHVPLLFYYPGVFERQRIAEPVELVDLYPTLLDLVAPGSEIPGLEGESLLPWLAVGHSGARKPPGTAYAFSEAGRTREHKHYRSVQDARWKLVFHPSVTRRRWQTPEIYELYDLGRDPLEADNVAELEPAQLRRLRGQLFAWMKGTWILPASSYTEEKSAATRDALRALGYVE